MIHCFDSNGDVTRIASTEESHVLSEPEVSFEESFVVPTLPPLDASTPVNQGVTEAASLEPQQISAAQDAPQDGVEQAVDVYTSVTDGYVDMAVPEMSSDTHSILQFLVCKAVARLGRVAEELIEFYRIRSL